MSGLAEPKLPLTAYCPDSRNTPVGQQMAAMVRNVAENLSDAAASFSAGMADAVTVLWSAFHEFDAADPSWPDRDRLVVSDPDGAALLAAVHELTGHGHDSAAVPPGLPGYGVAAGVGLALAERVLAARFGKSLVDHRTWVIASAAEMLAGSAFEAACLAGHLQLERLTVLLHAPEIDEDLLRRFAALGWATRCVPAADQGQIASVLSLARRSRKPTLIACTCDRPEDDLSRRDAATAWHGVGTRGATSRRAWLKRLARHPQRLEFERAVNGRLPEACMDSLASLRSELAAAECGTAAAGARVLAASTPLLPELLGGVCKDHAPSLGLATVGIGPGKFGARTLDYGVRIGAMMSAMAGMAAHGGILPCGAVSLAATDVLRPALRQAAMMRLRTILLARCSSAGGPPWQAVEQLTALRAMPNLLVLRPADGAEVAECWEIALRRAEGPSVIVLGPDSPAGPCQSTPDNRTANRSARGGYVLAEANGPRRATLIATGNEVAVAMAARALLGADSIAVASLPVWDLFGQADAGYRAGVLGSAPRFGIEAGGGLGWERWLGEDGVFIGSPSYEAASSATSQITAEAVATAVRKRLAQGH
jgi:transketolase